MVTFRNVSDKKGCQILNRVARFSNFHHKLQNKQDIKLKFHIPMFYGTRNQLITISSPSDKQGL